MITPTVWTLNFRGVSWLVAEAARWDEITRLAKGQDKKDAAAYLAQVRSELTQRLASYQTIGGTIAAGLLAPFEALGGSGGAGAQGAAASASQTIKETASAAADTATSIGKNLAIAAVAAAALYYFVTKGK